MKERYTRVIDVIIFMLFCIILIYIRDLRIRISDLQNCIIPMMEYMNARVESEKRIFKILLEEARNEDNNDG